MNFFSKNIKHLRMRKKFSQERLAEELGVTRMKIHFLETGQTKSPSVDDLMLFSDFYKITIDTLVKVDLTKINELKIRELESGTDIYIKGGNLRIAAITVNSENDENVEFVPVKAKAGYASGGFADPEYLVELPKYRLPNLNRNASYRIFPISGDSMLPFQSGSQIVGQFIVDWSKIKRETPCIVVLVEEQDIVFKMITFLDDGTFLLKSMNAAYAPYRVPATGISEIWQFHSYISQDIPENKDLNTVLNELKGIREDIHSLKVKKP